MPFFRTRRKSSPAESDSHPVDEVLPAGRMTVYGLQHVVAMYAGVVAPPLIIGGLPSRNGRRQQKQKRKRVHLRKKVRQMARK